MRRFGLLTALSLTLVCCPAPAAADTHVTTFAGSGSTGFADGPARSAQFMLPFGVAYDAGGNLYVADAAAQRIRKVSVDGTVTTVAGGGAPDASGVWVPGGYVDGDAAAARFNHPSALAVAADGRIYVADSYNHCIRVIAPDGKVSTVAGAPARSGLQTGPAATASFIMPMGLALDHAQNLYVVDAGLANGLRKIAPDGSVSAVTLPPHVQPPGGFALIDGPRGPTFVIADLVGLYVYRPDGTVNLFRNEFFQVQCAEHTAPGFAVCDQATIPLRAGRDIGAPFGVAAYDDHTIVYTDFRTNSVRYLDLRGANLRLLAGYPLGDGSARGAGSSDGAGTAATFNMPAGIAIGPHGELAIADAGSRLVRIVRDVDRSTALRPAELGARPASPGETVIAYAGDASAWQGTEWSDSIQGRLERRLRQAGRTVHVVPVVLDRYGDDSMTLASQAPRRFDVLMLQLNVKDAAALANVDVRQAIASPNLWRSAVTAALRRAGAAAKRGGARFVVVVQPLPYDVGPAQGFWGRADAASSQEAASVGPLRAAVASAGVPLVDASGDFAAAASSAVPAPLFSAGGDDFAAGGREALAGAAARALAAAR